MSSKIKYPVGVQTFSEIIEEGYLYVDKTDLVYRLTDRYKYVFLSRPRRFGKSLLMSTLEAYFKGRRELFEGLAISRLETKWESYPVFRFDLSPANFDSTQKVIDLITLYLDRIEHDYSLHSDDSSISIRFMRLIEGAYRKTGRKVVILIDEYDKPMLDCLHDPDLHGKIKDELRGFYSAIKACDEYIKFAMLTGITKFGKVSIFSGMNNLKDISLYPEFNALCGISESEFNRDFRQSLTNFSIKTGRDEQEVRDTFREMYDGYHFSETGENIYNPYSVLNAFDAGKLRGYWYESGSPNYLVRLIETNYYRLDSLEGAVRTASKLSDITDLEYDIVPLLYQSGYLTIKDYEEDGDLYTLGFPNREVRKAFWESMSKHFFRAIGGGSAFDIKKFLRELHEGNVDGFMKRLRSLFADTSSEPERRKEIHFQNMMAVVAKMLGLTVRTEVHSGAGRCDMQILTSSYVYIFEFKINGTPQEAMQQILDRGYLVPFEADPRKKFLIGASFSTKKRTISDWISDTVA